MYYRKFSKEEFENELTRLSSSIFDLDEWSEVSQELQGYEFIIQEYVYHIKTKNPAVSILIFSSISKTDEESRICGADAVRLVYKWNTKNGTLHKKIHKHKRINTLFQNLEETLKTTKFFGLDKSNWKLSLKASLGSKSAMEEKGPLVSA
jgi:hypothetical protein